MKRTNLIILALAATCAITLSARAGVLVNDTWGDSDRTDPAAPTYAENNGVTGFDADSDGNLESAWFKGGSGTMSAAPGDLQISGITNSSFWTTYFTPEATPASLANVGDSLIITWIFTPTGTITQNGSQGFNVALAQTPSGVRLTADGSAPSAAYQAYAVQMNMSPTFANSNPFQLREWSLAGSGSLLGTGANYTSLINGGTSGNTGYAAGTAYTFLMSLTRTVSGLDINASMTGGSLDGTGAISVSYSDSTPQGFTYDTFAIRPSGSSTGAAQYDTSLFKVELVQVPEPATFALAGLGLLGLIFARRARR